MALETWLIKLKTAISNSFGSVQTPPPKPNPIRKSNVGVLAFEITGLMTKLLHLWQSLSDKNITSLHNQSICLEGVRKIVSDDDAFLLTLACAEFAQNLNLVAESISRISTQCEDSNLRRFDQLYNDFARTGNDPLNWVLSNKEMEVKNKKMDRLVNTTSTLHKKMDGISVLESRLRRISQCNDLDESAKEERINDLQQKILWQRREIRYLKQRSLWNRSFDTANSMLVRSVFTVVARIKLVFCIGNSHGFPGSLPRSLSASATVHPSEIPNSCDFAPGPLKNCANLREKMDLGDGFLEKMDLGDGFFELKSKVLNPPSTTLGASALALHYANLIIVMEKMIRSPHLVGFEARDDVYAMLPISIRLSLRSRLKGVGFSAANSSLAGEWKDALGKILGWLAPLAHNMIKWHNERSFEKQNLIPKTNVLLLQTLYFASKEKTEAAITELLVGLNYICRFEREMNAKALYEYTNFNGGLLKLQDSELV